MAVQNRDQVLEGLAQDPSFLRLTVSDVEAIDQFLVAQWGIDLPPAPDQWDREIARRVPGGMLRQYHYLHDKQARYLERGKPIPLELETRFYDLVADQPLLGLVHSQKRTLILDTIALAEALVTIIGGGIRILDVGCHVGYMSIWLSRRLGVNVVGIDTSQAAIATATKTASNAVPPRFVHGDILHCDELGEFDLVMACDCYPTDSRHDTAYLQALTRRLAPDGILLVTGRLLEDHARLPHLIGASGLGYGLVDIIGGWLGDGRGYEAALAMALVNGGKRLLPVDFVTIAQESWPSFAEYANDPTTPSERKTVAYFRAFQRESIKK